MARFPSPPRCSTIADTASTVRIMKRALLIIGIFGFATLLAGCDKCGNFGPFFGQKACGDTRPAG